MNILENWKKQILMLFDKDVKAIFFLSLNKQIKTVISLFTNNILILVLFLGFICVTVAVFSYNNSFVSKIGLIALEFCLLLFLLLLRPSLYQKDFFYFSHNIKKWKYIILMFLLGIVFLPVSMLSLYMLLTALFFLIILDGSKRVTMIMNLLYTMFLFLIYNAPIMTCFLGMLFLLQKFVLFFCKSSFLLISFFSALFFISSLMVTFTLFVLFYVYEIFDKEDSYFLRD